MKLQDLRAAIRGIKGNPSVIVELVPGVPVVLVPQKTALLKALGDAYGDNRTAETGLTFNATTNFISVEGDEPASAADEFDAVQDAGHGSDDEDDLL